MKKNVWKHLLSAALVAGLCFGFAGAASFSDVTSANWYYDAVQTCSQKGYLNGYVDGTFRPNQSMTRAECAKMLSNINPYWDAELYYSDVNSSAWYAEAVSHYGPYMGGVTTDYTKSTPFGYAQYFHPEQNCSREDFAYGFGCVIGIPTDRYGWGFDDGASINSDYVNVITALKTYGILSGDGQGRYGNFNPKNAITRAEVAQILTNYVENYLAVY